MSNGLSLALGTDGLNPVVKVLAVVGGFVIAGLLTGVGAQAMAKLTTGFTIPRWPLHALRLLGGVAGGLLVWLLVFGGGGGGFGGPGGGFFGTGSGTSNKDKEKDKDTVARDKDRDKDSSSSTQSVEALRVEVLGNRTLEEVQGKSYSPERCYRIRGSDGVKILTLKELQKVIDPPAGERAWQKIVLVLYADSPDRLVSRVNDLKRWAERLQVAGPSGRVQVDFDRPPGNAPLK